MTLEQLKIFLAVAEHLHFTRAADALYVTQPAVSSAIQCLEEEYQVKLFHRVGRKVQITDAGLLLQQEAKKILEQVHLTERNLRELNNLQRGELKLGCSLTIGNYWLPSKISQFKQQYPGITVHCTLGNAQEIVAGTVAGHFDLGLMTGDVKLAVKNNLLRHQVGNERLQIVVGQSHPWFQREYVSVDELLKTAWVMREAGSGAQQMFEQALQSWGVDLTQLNIVLVLNSSEMVKAVVEGGVGAAAIPELMASKEIQLKTLKGIKVKQNHTDQNKKLEIIQPIWQLKHSQRFPTKILTAFEEILLINEIYQIHGNCLAIAHN